MNADEHERFRLAVASRAHETETEYGRAAGVAAASTGMETVKAILLINGGACVAILAFIGTFTSSGRATPELTSPLIWFAAGALFAVVSAALGFLTNQSYAAASNAKTRHFDEPYVRETDASRRHQVAGAITRWLSIGCAIAGMLAFVGGVFDANCAFRHVRMEKPPSAAAATTQNPK